MSPHFFAHIIYILEFCEVIENLLKIPEEIAKFAGCYDAILHRLQTLSESTQKLPDDIKQQHRHVNWRRFAGMRNAIVHDYLGDIYVEKVYQFIHEELPTLKQAMENQLPEWRELRARLQED